ncbi:MAG: hypothetical protein SVK08_13330, partial [Halobacteriota archaeon]|nr:hypothetical protein [Halobacteriota archaeon]
FGGVEDNACGNVDVKSNTVYREDNSYAPSATIFPIVLRECGGAGANYCLTPAFTGSGRDTLVLYFYGDGITAVALQSIEYLSIVYCDPAGSGATFSSSQDATYTDDPGDCAEPYKFGLTIIQDDPGNADDLVSTATARATFRVYLQGDEYEDVEVDIPISSDCCSTGDCQEV